MDSECSLEKESIFLTRNLGKLSLHLNHLGMFTVEIRGILQPNKIVQVHHQIGQKPDLVT